MKMTTKEFEVSIDGHEPKIIEAESAEDAAHYYVRCFYPGPADQDVSIVIKDGDKSKTLNATIEYDADVFIKDEWDDDDDGVSN